MRVNGAHFALENSASWQGGGGQEAYHLISIGCGPGAGRTCFTLTRSPCSPYSHSHSTDEATEAKGGEVTDLESPSWKATALCDAKPSLPYQAAPAGTCSFISSATSRTVQYHETVQVQRTPASREGLLLAVMRA